MTLKHSHLPSGFAVASQIASFLLVAQLLFNTLALTVQAQARTSRIPHANASLTENQRILHVLNRLGFGARPGDVERVKGMGLGKYIEEQLSPEKINDALADAKVKNLPTLHMTTAELYERFPQPGQLLRQLERRGELPPALAAARDNRVKNTANATANPPNDPSQQQMNTAMAASPEMNANKAGVGKTELNGDPRDQKKYRQAIREYYLENGLQSPQRITAELQASRILRAVYSERQLLEVMVDFWTNHFNVFAGKGADKWLLISYDRDAIRPNAMGKFSDLLLSTAQSPAMLFYLDNFQSVSPSARLGIGPGPRGVKKELVGDEPVDRRAGMLGMSKNPQQERPQQQARRGINENYARELMELHTLGVDGGYTQKDVQEVARCFTGWTILAPRGGAAAAEFVINGSRAQMLRENAGKFFFNPRAHDNGEKLVLGHKIPAGGGFKDGLIVLDLLAHHSSTAKYISAKLLRHFVSDNPSPALVDRIAASFTKSDGDIRETLRAIFSSPEFNSQEAYRAKVKRPFELAISAIRTLGGETNGGPQIHQWISRMGEPLYGFQTPNGYSDATESWVNTGGLLERLNFAVSLASNRIPGTRVELGRLLGQSEDLQSLNKTQIMNRFLDIIVAGGVSSQTRQTLMKQLSDENSLNRSAEAGQTNGPPARRRGAQTGTTEVNIADPIARVVGLLLGSPEFQRQ
ncbi:MAG: DUF1800 domain-containing protein [Pyrinomonadaceae bacterium]